MFAGVRVALDERRAWSGMSECDEHGSCRAALRGSRHDTADPLDIENLLVRCMLRSCMETTHEAQRILTSPCGREPAALGLTPSRSLSAQKPEWRPKP